MWWRYSSADGRYNYAWVTEIGATPYDFEQCPNKSHGNTTFFGNAPKNASTVYYKGACAGDQIIPGEKQSSQESLEDYDRFQSMCELYGYQYCNSAASFHI